MSEERANTHQVCYALEQRLQAACHQEQELTLSSQDGAQTLTAWRLDLESHVLRAPHPSHLQAAVPGKHTACPDGKFLIVLDTFLQSKSCTCLQIIMTL